MTSSTDQRTASQTGSKTRLWSLRMWHGMPMTAWLKLLARNRFAVCPARLGMALILSGCSVLNSLLGLVQKLIYGRRIAQTQIEQDPVFILGHWRSGTTLLHELLVLDPRHTYPDTYACFAPNHFLVSRRLIAWWLRLLLPSRRPMDNVRMGWNRPQEEEFALCSMGMPSPYLMFAFPNRPPPFCEYRDLRDLPDEARRRWKDGLLWFLKCVTFRSPKRLVLKSPQHTCRIEVLLELFPKARFVHIVRDPYVIFPSMFKTWKRLATDNGLQLPKCEGLEELVLSTFQHMYEVFESTRPLIDPKRFCEVRYEDLVRDSVGQMQTVYEKLELGGFDDVLPALEGYAKETSDFSTNRYELSPDIREKVSERWGAFIRRYGYDVTTP